MARRFYIPASISSHHTLGRHRGGSRSGALWASSLLIGICGLAGQDVDVSWSPVMLVIRYILQALNPPVSHDFSIKSLSVMESILTIGFDLSNLLRFTSSPCSMALIDGDCTCDDRSYTENTVCDDVSR